MQRESVSAQKSTTAAPGTPAPSQAAAPAAAKPQAAPGAPAAQPKRSWMGPLAGLAAGLGLAALASHFGFGEGLANMMMIGMLILAVVMVIGFVMRRRAAGRQPALAGAGGMQYAGAGADLPRNRPLEPEFPAPLAGGGAVAVAAEAGASRNIPAEFDVEGFIRNAKVNFIRLQAANDAGNVW